MSDYNRVTIEGRLVRDADVKDFAKGEKWTRFSCSVISNKSKKGADGKYTDEPSFFDCIIWGKEAEGAFQKAKKGAKVVVFGELLQNRWKDKDGKNQSKIVINVEKILFIETGKTSSSTPKTNSSAENPALESYLQGDEDVPF